MTRPNLKLHTFNRDEEQREPAPDEIQSVWPNLLDWVNKPTFAGGGAPLAESAVSTWLKSYVQKTTEASKRTPEAPEMSTPTREEFEARIETVEARMETRVERIEGRINAFLAQAEERERRLEERDKRIETIAASAAKSAEQAVNLKTNMWLAALTVIIFVVGTVVAAYFATQSSNIGITQTTIAAFQQGQQTPPKK